MQNNIDLVLENLEQAIGLNPEYREIVKTNSIFDTVREDKRFKELLNKHQPIYLQNYLY